jgi:hypothetical protein
MNILRKIKRLFKNVLSYPVSTVQGVMFAICAILTYYGIISLEEGGIWLAALIAIIKMFSNDSSYVDVSGAPKEINPEVTSKRKADVGGGTLGTTKN